MKCMLIVPVLIAAAMAAHAREYEVAQQNKQFAPAEVTAAVGDDLAFVNQDTVVHNVVSVTEGHEFDLGFQRPGERAKVRMKAPGRLEVRCAIHPKMKATVTVK